jgi:hypothetical protein
MINIDENEISNIVIGCKWTLKIFFAPLCAASPSQSLRLNVPKDLPRIQNFPGIEHPLSSKQLRAFSVFSVPSVVKNNLEDLPRVQDLFRIKHPLDIAHQIEMIM